MTDNFQNSANDETWVAPKEPPMFKTMQPAAPSAATSANNWELPSTTRNILKPQPESEPRREPIANIAIAPETSPNSSVAFDELLQIANDTERRSKVQETARAIGNVIRCSGSKVTISTEANNKSLLEADTWAVGQMISIKSKFGRIVAMVREMMIDKITWDDEGINQVSVYADLLGEVTDDPKRGTTFKRGVSQYPGVGSIAHKMRREDLECIYDIGERKGIMVGELSQSSGIAAVVGLDDILRRHCAIVGTTGAGKSCAVGLIVTKVLEADKNLRVVVLDPHNEFAGAFGNYAHCLDQNNLNLPFWLLNYEELEDVIFRGRPVVEESDILRELVLGAKTDKANSKAAGLRAEVSTINIDTAVYYRLCDVYKLIDEILGQLEPRFKRTDLRSLRTRIEIIEGNPRYAFMFSRGGREDNFDEVIANIFRLPANGKPLSAINLSGLPSEVVNCVASVIARLSFEVARASHGAIKVLLVCEEAHRYVPHDPSLGFMPTRRAISRIAKEGRKYGCAIAIVTQRPGELDSTILSQCSTVFAMRLTNEKDQEIIRSALSDSSTSVISFLPSLDNREAIAFGEGVSVPMRLRFADHALVSSAATQSTFAKVLCADDVRVSQLTQSMRGIETQQRYIPHEIVQNPAPAANLVSQISGSGANPSSLYRPAAPLPSASPQTGAQANPQVSAQTNPQAAPQVAGASIRKFAPFPTSLNQ